MTKKTKINPKLNIIALQVYKRKIEVEIFIEKHKVDDYLR